MLVLKCNEFPHFLNIIITLLTFTIIIQICVFIWSEYLLKTLCRIFYLCH